MAQGTATNQKIIVDKVVDGIESIALSKYSVPKGIREKVTVGTHAVDMTVHVVGTVTVGEDYEQSIITSLPMAKLICKLASQISQERLVEFLSPESLAKISDKEVEDFSSRIQSEWEKLSQSVKKTCKGKVTAKLNFAKA